MNKIRKYILESTTFTIFTSVDSGHKHKAQIDKDGDGKTVSTSGTYSDHIHKIKEFVVKREHMHKHKLQLKTGWNYMWGGRTRTLDDQEDDDDEEEPNETPEDSSTPDESPTPHDPKNSQPSTPDSKVK